MAEVTKSEAARLAGVTRQTIHRKVKSGDLSAIRGKIDTSELIRVFGSISDGTVTPKLQPDAAVQTTLQAKVDGLESQLAVTREQLADTSKDRDEWRDIAKEATSNVKLITDQRSTPRNNDNMMIFIGLAFLIGIGVTYMMLSNDLTADRPLPAPVDIGYPPPIESPETTDGISTGKYFYSIEDQLRVELGAEPKGPFRRSGQWGGIPLGTNLKGDTVKLKEVSPRHAAQAEAEQGAYVTENVTTE